ncbi:thioredoxin family protein [Afipia sp. TerB]
MYHRMTRTLQKSFVIALAVLTLSLSGLTLARASELVMFERAGCVWCQRWDRAIAPIYGKTDEAKLLPLRRIDIDRQSADGIVLAAPVRFTPTFVVVDQGREVGRIVGYANDESFWGLLAKLAAKIDPSYRNLNRT